MVTAYRSKSIDQPGLIYVIHSIVHTSHARGSLLLLAIFMIHQRVDITFSEGIYTYMYTIQRLRLWNDDYEFLFKF